MNLLPVPDLDPALLPGGTVVSRWRVVAWAGQGVHGAVYRAVPLGLQHAPAVALKLAVSADNLRFAREAALLSRLRHPSIPRLWDSGVWQVPGGGLHPFLVMDWVDGKPLDEQSLYPRFSPQSVEVLAQLARALEQIHALGAIHRDIKSDNILVRYSDGRALLMDFGSCHFPGASALTPPATHPGTPAYRSPESWCQEFNRDRSPPQRALAADDLFALGLTACRLVCGEEPQLSSPRRDEHGQWHVDAVTAPAALRDKRIEPRLRACILRLLSVRPQERGTAAALAEDLEQLAAPRSVPSPASRPPELPSLTRPPEDTAAVALERKGSPRKWRRLALAAAVTLAVGAGGLGIGRTGHIPCLAHTEDLASRRSEQEMTGLGEAATSTAAPASLHEPRGLAEDTLPAPLPEQVRPDSKGRCPHNKQVALNGGCWVEMPLDRDHCEAVTLSGQLSSLYKNKCYMPVLSHGRQPNSSPTTPP